MRKRLLFYFLFVLLMALLEPSVWAQGCAMCKTALEQSPEGQALAKSFDYGILFLMGVPYAMFGTAGFFAFRAYRKHVKKAENGESEQH